MTIHLCCTLNVTVLLNTASLTIELTAIFSNMANAVFTRPCESHTMDVKTYFKGIRS